MLDYRPGGGTAHVFVKAGVTWHTLKSGTKAELKRDRRGEVTPVRDTAR